MMKDLGPPSFHQEVLLSCEGFVFLDKTSQRLIRFLLLLMSLLFLLMSKCLLQIKYFPNYHAILFLFSLKVNFVGFFFVCFVCFFSSP